MVESVSEDLEKNKDRVFALLSESIFARNNDLYLQILYLKKHLNIEMPFIPWNVIEANGGIMESIRRVRAEIQNDDEDFPPTEGTRAARWKREHGFHEHYARKRRERGH